MKLSTQPKQTTIKNANKTWKDIWKDREFYMILIPGVLLTLLFMYVPMYGVLIAFRKTRLGSGFNGDWVGFKNFERLFNSGQFSNVLRNTLKLNLIVMICGLPAPIILALMLHNTSSPKLKKFAQTSTYLPHLLSVVVMIEILGIFCNGEYGLINIVLRSMGKEPINFFGESKYFIPMYFISAIWKSSGYSAIIYLSALTSIDKSVIEAATIDGASKLQRMWHVDLKLILPTIVTIIILDCGKLMSFASMDKVLLMQTQLNLDVSEILSTYVYKVGVAGAQYGFGAAVGLFNNVCNIILLFVANWISKRVAKTSMF